MPESIHIVQMNPPISNDVAQECIYVPKVYDWVIITENIRTTISIPTSLPANCPVTVTEFVCSLGTTPFFPISCIGNRACTVLDRRPAHIDGVHAQIVKLRQEVPIDFTFIGKDEAGAPASCTMQLPVSFIHQVILCFPDEFTDENLVCRILSSDCTVTTDLPIGGGIVPTAIGIELLLCIEIQVLAVVKLEVLARFCSPRPPVPITSPTVCPSLFFPEQCHFFPQLNCPCQVAIRDTCLAIEGGFCLTSINGEPVIGTQILEAVICNYCLLAQSSINFRFISEDNQIQNFTFTANSFTVEELCSECGPCSELLVYGEGTVGMGGETILGEYALVLGIGFYQLFLIFPDFLVYVENFFVPMDHMKFNQCRSFPEPLT